MWITLVACLLADETNLESGSGGPTGETPQGGGPPPGTTPMPPAEGEVVLVWSGNVAEGSPIPLDWAENSSVACFPANLNPYYEGAHVFNTVELPAGRRLVLTVLPANGVDVSLYGIANAATSEVVFPPDVGSAGACEASPDGAPFAGPGQVEEVSIYRGDTDSIVVVGVAGVAETEAGAFTLRAVLADP